MALLTDTMCADVSPCLAPVGSSIPQVMPAHRVPHRTFVAQAVVKPPERPVTPRHARELTEEIQVRGGCCRRTAWRNSAPQLGSMRRAPSTRTVCRG